MEVAQTIAKQIGNKALYMIGAKNLMADTKSLTFKVMRNERKVTHVKIELTSMDDYDLTFYAIRGTSIKIKSESKGIYCDQLNAAIEENTALYTSL